MHEPASSPEQAALDQQIAETRAALAGAPAGTGARPAHEQKLEMLYRQRYPEPGVTPPPSPPPTPSLDTLDQAIEANRDARATAPAGWGLREDLDQERLALFRARHGEEEGDDATEPAAPVAVNWGPGNVSPSDAETRRAIEGHFGTLSLSSAEGNHVLERARVHAFTTMSDEEYEDRKVSAERTLRAAWGRDYDAKLRNAYLLFDDFERRFGQLPDVDRALDNGLGFDVPLLQTLAAVGDRRGMGQNLADISRLRAELVTVDPGSLKHAALSRELESRYRRLHGQ